jgi:hypothetical protein
MTATRQIIAVLLGLSACRSLPAPEKAESDWRPPRALPCTVDRGGNPAGEGTHAALCCPEGYVAGGGAWTGCPRGACCAMEDGLGKPPPMPEAPGANRPGS